MNESKTFIFSDFTSLKAYMHTFYSISCQQIPLNVTDRAFHASFKCNVSQKHNMFASLWRAADEASSQPEDGFTLLI